MIEFQNVALSYQKGEEVLRDVNFSVQEGEFIYLIGENGAGKSTIFELMCKELRPTKGEIWMFGKNIRKVRETRLRRQMGIVFQDHSKYLLSNKTVYENIAYVLECLGENPFRISKKVKETLKMMGLEEHEKKKPYELSGGQKQCVSIARAIVTKPRLLVCDEPTANLSAENRDLVMRYLREINKTGTTVLLVTHDAEILSKQHENHRVLVVGNGEVYEQGIKGSKRMSSVEKETSQTNEAKPYSVLQDILEQKRKEEGVTR